MRNFIYYVGLIYTIFACIYIAMSESEEEISLNDNEIDPTELYTMDDYLQQRNAWNAAAAQLAGHLMMSSLEASSSRQRRGSRRTVRRDRVGGNARIVANYFCDNPVYNEVDFRRRFRMSKPLFLSVLLMHWGNGQSTSHRG